MHVPVADGLVGRHLAIRLDAVLQTEKLPAPGPKTSYPPMISRKSHGTMEKRCLKAENEP